MITTIVHRGLRLFQPLIVRCFHMLFYMDAETTWASTTWMGVPCLKNPFDAWIYQEILHRQRPDVLIECGTNRGGSAYFFGHLFDLMGTGRIISIDINDNPGKPVHPRVEYLVMSSTSPECMAALRERIKPGERVMAVLDSDHSKAHVQRELQLYAPLVTPGQYLVVEDTNVNGHPVTRSFGPGPMEAVHEFLTTTNEFTVDRAFAERLKLTFFPNGWLRKQSA
jgi:cephalosporin hydroxylase